MVNQKTLAYMQERYDSWIGYIETSLGIVLMKTGCIESAMYYAKKAQAHANESNDKNTENEIMSTADQLSGNVTLSSSTIEWQLA